jgi:hypothetical protein
MKKQSRRLVLNRETLVRLSEPGMDRKPNGEGFEVAYTLPNCTSPWCGPTVCRCELEGLK